MLMGGLTGIDLVDHSEYEPPVGRTSLTSKKLGLWDELVNWCGCYVVVLDW